MTDEVTRAPEPPDLLPPWRTPQRERLMFEARAFARDVVLPLADELDPQKGLIPAQLLTDMAVVAGSASPSLQPTAVSGWASSSTASSRRSSRAPG